MTLETKTRVKYNTRLTRPTPRHLFPPADYSTLKMTKPKTSSSQAPMPGPPQLRRSERLAARRRDNDKTQENEVQQPRNSKTGANDANSQEADDKISSPRATYHDKARGVAKRAPDQSGESSTTHTPVLGNNKSRLHIYLDYKIRFHRSTHFWRHVRKQHIRRAGLPLPSQHVGASLQDGARGGESEPGPVLDPVATANLRSFGPAGEEKDRQCDGHRGWISRRELNERKLWNQGMYQDVYRHEHDQLYFLDEEGNKVWLVDDKGDAVLTQDQRY